MMDQVECHRLKDLKFCQRSFYPDKRLILKDNSSFRDGMDITGKPEL